MAGRIIADESEARSVALSSFLREVLALALTIIAAITLVALLMFAPRAFLGEQAGFGVYLSSVRDYLLGLLHGDLGRDARGPVSSDLLLAARRSLELLGASLAVGLLLGLLWGALLATVRRLVPAIVLFGLSTLLISLPTFVVILLAIEAVATLTLRTGIRLALVQGYGLDRHLILPTAVLALRGAAYMARGIQVAQEEILRQDWIRAARARGLGGLALWRRHILPALRLPLLGSALGTLRVMVGGLMIVDYIYGWGGLGGRMLRISSAGVVSAANDRRALGAAVLFVLFFIGVDMLGRLALRRADPRIRLQEPASEG
jgi:ABC-type dipeptide/oligopeptide/nickel transport system permease component